MKLYNTLRIAISLSILSLCGCGSVGMMNTATSTFTGSWVITAEVPNPAGLNGNGASGSTAVDSWAFLSQDGTSVSGMVEDNFCGFVESTYPVVGSLNSGKLTLVPAVAPALQVDSFSLNAAVSANLTTLQGEAINTPSGCGSAPVLTVIGQQVASFAGNWKGTLTSVTGHSATISANIIEAGPDLSGFPALSGDVAISGSPCFTAGTLVGNQVGTSLNATISTTNGTIEIPQVESGGSFLDSSGQLVVSYSVQGGTCNGDYAQGTLTRQ